MIGILGPAQWISGPKVKTLSKHFLYLILIKQYLFKFWYNFLFKFIFLATWDAKLLINFSYSSSPNKIYNRKL